MVLAAAAAVQCLSAIFFCCLLRPVLCVLNVAPSDSHVGAYKDPILNLLYDPGLTVEQIRDLELRTWHWYPWKHIEYTVLNDGVFREKECEKNDSVEELPEDLFTQEQRQQGAILLHFLGAIYFFTVLAVVCDSYFLPSVECICEDLDISQDVAAATFMSVASNTPELFTNMISTFVAESTEMGLGTIIGSMLFNTLGVAACASLASVKPVQLDWFPVTRDSLILAINLTILAGMTWDGKVMWYEASILFLLFIIYFFVLFKNHRWEKCIRKFVESRLGLCCPPKDDTNDTEKCSDKKFAVQPKESYANDLKREYVAEDSSVSHYSAMFTIPDKSTLKQLWWFYTWPIKYVLLAIVPNPKTNRKWYPVSFIVCILLIGANSYLIYWMVALIGRTLGIPESVMGLTLLACGGCLPEAIACVILIRRGEGSFGVSNSLGANSLAILMSLGVPWFVKTMIEGAGTTQASIKISSLGIVYTIASLLLAVLTLYVILSLARHKLRRGVGFALISAYAVFITVAILVELDTLFPSGNKC